MELDQVAAVLAIVRHGGFTSAAASLHLSQPAISRRIHLLERELGAPLFERVGSGAVLSDAGRAFVPYAEALMATVRDGRDAVQALRGTRRGSLTLALVGSLASTALTSHLRTFRATYPGVDVRLQTALSAEVSALVRRGDATLGLRYAADPHADLVSIHVYDEPMLPVCSPQHRLAQARRVRLADLAGERWLTFPRRSGGAPEPYATALAGRLAAAGLQDAADIVAIDSLTAQKRMVEAGFGLALLPASSVDDELRSGALCELRSKSLHASLPIVLIHRRHAFLSGAAQALMDVLRQPPPVGGPGAPASA